MMTNKCVYELLEARSVLLKYVHERKLRSLGYIKRQPWENIEGSLVLLRESEVAEGRKYSYVDWANWN